MIAKRITSKAAKPRIARLVRYVVAAQGGIDPRSWSRTADYMLASGTSSRGEKVGGVRVTNCNTDDPAAATTLIEATQAANTRSKTDKTYHLVFSFPPGEEPPLGVLHQIEDQLVAAIGYAEHQRISAVHIDTDHLHVHVAINKVHPKGFQNIEPYYDKKKLMETCERLELEYGLQRTNHGLDGREPKMKVKPKQAEAEAHSGTETLVGYVSREVAPAMRNATSWHELHSVLAGHGLTIKRRGAGLVIGSGEAWARASQIDRAFSLKGLTDRLGPFEQKTQRVRKPYEPKPLQKHPSGALLFEQYQREKLGARVAWERGCAQLKYESDLLNHQLRKWNVAQRLMVRTTLKGPTKLAMLKVIHLQTDATRRRNWSEIEQKRRQLFVATITPNWAAWLINQADNGNTEALAVLRSRQEKAQRRGDFLTAQTPDATEHVIAHHLRPEINKKGFVTYYAPDGGVVIDRAHHVQCFKTSAKSLQLTLELAAERFKGQTLIVEGQESFQKEVARIAKLRGIKVRFTNPAIEKVCSKSNEAEL